MNARMLLAVLPLGCSSFELAPIELDVSSNCNRVAVTELVAELDGPARPWDRVVAMAVDAPGLTSGWLLVVRHDPGGPDELGLVYLDAEGTVVVEHGLAQPPAVADTFELLPSAEPGVAWLSQGAVGSFNLWRLDVGALVSVSTSPNLAAIPLFCDLDHDGVHESCDSWQWPHRIVFVRQRPHLLTLPPASIDAQIDLWVTPFEWPRDGIMQVQSDIVLHFKPECEWEDIESQEICEALVGELSYPRIQPLALQHDARTQRTELLLYRELDDAGVRVPDIALVVLTPGEPWVGGRMLTPPGLPAPRDAGASGVAQDVFSSYLGYIGIDGTPVLAQRPPGLDDDEPFVLLDREGLQLELDHELAQLDDDIVMQRIHDGAWELLKVFPDAPERSQVTVYDEPGELVEVRAAGPSSFVLHEADGGASLVRVACDGTDDTDG